MKIKNKPCFLNRKYIKGRKAKIFKENFILSLQVILKKEAEKLPYVLPLSR